VKYPRVKSSAIFRLNPPPPKNPADVAIRFPGMFVTLLPAPPYSFFGRQVVRTGGLAYYRQFSRIQWGKRLKKKRKEEGGYI
jgi:hypothetical protein